MPNTSLSTYNISDVISVLLPEKGLFRKISLVNDTFDLLFSGVSCIQHKTVLGQWKASSVHNIR